jgi:hypothetical protein
MQTWPLQNTVKTQITPKSQRAVKGKADESDSTE